MPRKACEEGFRASIGPVSTTSGAPATIRRCERIYASTGYHRVKIARIGVTLPPDGAGIVTPNLDEDRATSLHGAPWMAGIAQLVERQVVVLDVTGSSPVARPTIALCVTPVP
jgi:hypothetical protein